LAGGSDSETFIRPPEVCRVATSLPAPLYNRCRRLLARAPGDCLFVPIRTLQFQGVIDREEIIFVDGGGGYLMVDGQGGRPIRIAWRIAPAAQRHSLTAPVACEVIHYGACDRELQRRLVGEFSIATRRLEARFAGQELPPQGARILPLGRR